MPNNRCKATTKSGERCKLPPGSSGYCHIHDPDRIAAPEAKRERRSRPARRFSERKGFKPVRTAIQVDGMTAELRNSIWNVLSHHVMGRYRGTMASLRFHDREYDDFTLQLWADFFKEPVDLAPNSPEDILKAIYKRFSSAEWYEVYDFLEFILNIVNGKLLNAAVNDVLERELSGYRFVGGVVTDITDEQEVEMLEDALTDEDFPSVRAHLERALELLSDREKPDYRNSIKESISAVESMARVITGNNKATLGQALKALERSGEIHPALKGAFTKMYGYTSDEDGIRHAMLAEPDLTAADAKFFLLSCTSFINYLKAKLSF